MKTKFLALLILALTLCVGAIFVSGTALASSEAANQVLSVDSAWVEGDTLYIAVTNTQTGVAQTLTISLLDYANSTDEYISVQAVDGDGNTSNTVRFQNPYYQPTTVDSEQLTVDSGGPETNPEPSTADSQDPSTAPSPSPNLSTVNSQLSTALTPDGTGTVMDNVTGSGGQEIYTVSTADGNVFYVVIDPNRATDNVYLLNAVTEDDLASLAKPGDGTTSGAVPVTPSPTPEPTPSPSPSPPAAVTPAQSGGICGGTIIFILIVALAAGGAGYYFKILKPKRQAAEPEDEYEGEPEREPAYDEPDEYTEYDGYGEDGR